MKKAETGLACAEKWIQSYGPVVLQYYVEERHRAVRITRIFDKIYACIDQKDAVAARIACDFLIDDIKSPFGGIIKNRLARVLKRNVHLIDAARRSKLMVLAHSMESMQYRPREFAMIRKLVSKIEST